MMGNEFAIVTAIAFPTLTANEFAFAGTEKALEIESRW
jgi:hypothetical protein